VNSPTTLDPCIAALRDVGLTHLNVTPLPTDGQTAGDVIAAAKEMAQ
jgi:hypothetical protein